MGHSLPEFGRWSELPMMGIVLALCSAGEELGWRGFFLPTLMKGNSLLAATGWMALFWGFWHLPFYLAVNSEGQSTWLQYPSFLRASSLFRQFSRLFTHEPEACFSASFSTARSMLERSTGSAHCPRLLLRLLDEK
jgi:membrane protease YdiL (CAAX protease family)